MRDCLSTSSICAAKQTNKRLIVQLRPLKQDQVTSLTNYKGLSVVTLLMRTYSFTSRDLNFTQCVKPKKDILCDGGWTD